ncbi:MAG TPA: hypothetical protein VHT34_09775 [Clostridia bacterium]|nr:hypothetical protein [Clostridia bacterium]
MNKKRILAIVMTVVMALAFLTGCGGKKTSVKDDLTNYDKEASKIMQEMKKTDTKDIDKFQAAMKDGIKKFEDIDIKTDDVKDLNKLAIKGFEGLVDAISEALKAQKNNDMKLQTKATEKYEKATKVLGDFEKKYEALGKKEGVTLKLTVN